MKKKFLLFTLFCGSVALTLSSYKNGPAASGAGNLTGSNGATCAQSGCHTSGSSSTAATIIVRPKNGSTPVTKYLPNTAYTVTLGGTNTSLSKFGFQIVAMNGSKQAVGTISNNPANTHITNNILEHSAALSKNGIGVYEVTFDWMSPAASAGPVTFYGIINAVNGDNSTSGDAVSAPVTATLSDASNVNDVNNQMTISTYPNPAKNMLVVKVDNATTGDYTINAFDISGRKMMEHTVNNTDMTLVETINTEKWASGMYHVQVIKDGQKHITPVLKN